MKAETFIKTIKELYVVPDKDLEQMYKGQEQMEKALRYFSDNDIIGAINHYFVKKNDRTRPRLAQILAILDEWVRDKKIDFVIATNAPLKHELPTTNIYSIKSVFDKLVGVLVRAGVIMNQDGKFENTHSLVAPDTDLLMLNPQQKLRWLVDDAKKEQPDLFCKFENTNWIEDLAIALQNNLIKIKVRDWSRVSNIPERTFNLNDMVNRI